ncbi:MAG TPA: glycosyltransferase [Pirellulaceae bacterium]|nr:glycosyltransferase [Pirellulaceae bacterium]
MFKPIRVLFLATELGFGGAEKNLTRIATELDRARFAPVVCSIAPLPQERRQLLKRLEIAGVPVHSLDAPGAAHLFQALRRLKRLLDELQPDVMQTFLFHANVLGAWAARGRDLRLVAGYRVADPRRWRTTLERKALARAESAVCVSESVRTFYAQERSFPHEKLIVIPNSVDVPDPETLERPTDYPAAPVDRMRAISVGRLHPQKGLDLGLQWIATALDMGANLDWTIVGGGPERQRLEALAKQSSVADRVHFVGWRDDVAAWLAASDVFLLPSRWEGMPNALLEAFAMGLPALASDAEGVVETMGQDLSFQLVPIGNPFVASSRLAALAADPTLRSRLGDANRERMRESFSPASVIDRYARLYASLCSSASRGPDTDELFTW